MVWYAGLAAGVACWIAWKLVRNRIANGSALAAPLSERTHKIVENGQPFFVNLADARLHYLGSVGFFVALGIAVLGWLVIQQGKRHAK
jgi:hypothetical protein